MTIAEPVLVTGSAGFIGSHVKARLAAQGAEVVAIDHAWRSRDELAALIGPRPVASCIHLGWYARPTDYLTATGLNLRSLNDSIDLVELLATVGCEHLVVAGSCAEYAPADGPMGEDSRVAPWSAYGAAKAALHLLLDSSVRPAGMDVTWARIFHLTGPGEHPDRLVPMVTRSLLAGSAIDLSPGEQQRDFLDVDDVASALVWLAEHRPGGSVNVCSGDAVSLRDVLEALAAEVGAEGLLRFGARDYGEHDAMVVVGDASRLRATGWKPLHSFSEMIDRVVEHWRGEALVGARRSNYERATGMEQLP